MKEFIGLGLFLSAIAAYITHLWWSIGGMFGNGNLATIGDAVLALAGLIIPPIGVIHGYMIWF